MTCRLQHVVLLEVRGILQKEAGGRVKAINADSGT